MARERSVSGGDSDGSPVKVDAYLRFKLARAKHPECRAFVSTRGGEFVPDDGLQKGRRWRFENDLDLAKIKIELERMR